MKVLFTAAEQQELDCAISAYERVSGTFAGQTGDFPAVEFHLTGIGATQACHKVTREILYGRIKGDPYTLVVNIGIAGSYDLELFPTGAAAVISEEHFGDLGFETSGGFVDLFTSGILEQDSFPYTGGALKRRKLPYEEIEKVLGKYMEGIGVTVQTVTGDASKVQELCNRYNPHIESMEGAAVYYAALHEEVPFFELRTVSNAVGEQDRKKWDTEAALATLGECCTDIMTGIFKQCGYGECEKGNNKD